MTSCSTLVWSKGVGLHARAAARRGEQDSAAAALPPLGERHRLTRTWRQHSYFWHERESPAMEPSVRS